MSDAQIKTLAECDDFMLRRISQLGREIDEQKSLVITLRELVDEQTERIHWLESRSPFNSDTHH